METYKVIATKSNGNEVSFEIKAYGRYNARERAFECCYRFGVCFKEMFLVSK